MISRNLFFFHWNLILLTKEKKKPEGRESSISQATVLLNILREKKHPSRHSLREVNKGREKKNHPNTIKNEGLNEGEKLLHL